MDGDAVYRIIALSLRRDLVKNSVECLCTTPQGTLLYFVFEKECKIAKRSEDFFLETKNYLVSSNASFWSKIAQYSTKQRRRHFVTLRDPFFKSSHFMALR